MHTPPACPRRAALLLALLLVVLGALPLAKPIYARAIKPLAQKQQVTSITLGDASANLSLPFATGETWLYSQGPHDAPIRPALDFAKNGGTVRAAADGIVAYEPCSNGFNHKVVIDHQNGWKTGYAHLVGIIVSPGQTIRRGDALGTAATSVCPGETATGAHVHFWVRQNGQDRTMYNVVIGGWLVEQDGCLKRLSNNIRKCPGSWIDNDGTVGDGGYKAAYADQSYLPTMPAGLRQNVQLKLKNTGTATWDSNTHLAPAPRDVASPLYDPATWFSSSRIMSAGTIAPNQIGTFNFALRAPTTPGKYRINFTLVQEGVAWFSQPGDADIWFEVTVTEAVGAGSSRQQLFVDAYNRNGGIAPLGSPLAQVSWSGPPTDATRAIIQALSTGAFIIHDEQRDNPPGSVPAYVLGGPILKHFQSLDGSRSWLGAGPTSDQFTNAAGQQQSNFPNGSITWNGTTAEAKPWPSAIENQWHTEYHNGTNLNAGATWVVNEDNPSHDWKEAAPGNGKWGVWSDFVLRSTARLNFEAGEYTFVGNADDTVRVWLDGEQIINMTLAEGRVTRTLSAGQHDLRVEYVDTGGNAALSFWWVKEDSSSETPPPLLYEPTATPEPTAEIPPVEDLPATTPEPAQPTPAPEDLSSPTPEPTQPTLAPSNTTQIYLPLAMR